MDSDSRDANIDPDQLARENAQGDSDRLPDGGAPGLGSSDGDVPPDAIRGPLGSSVEADDDDDLDDEDDDDVEVADLP